MLIFSGSSIVEVKSGGNTKAPSVETLNGNIFMVYSIKNSKDGFLLTLHVASVFKQDMIFKFGYHEKLARAKGKCW